jgi:PAS domain S-box-containing protein
MNLNSQTQAGHNLDPWFTSNELAVLVSPSCVVLEVNPAFARKVGQTRETCVGVAFESWCLEEERQVLKDRIKTVSSSKSFDQLWRTVQGWRWIEWESTAHEGVMRLVGRDVSTRHLAEGHLARLSQAVEQAPFGVLILSPTGNVQYMNAAYTEYSGFTLEDALEPDFAILTEGHQSEASYRSFCASLAAGTPWQGTLRCPTKEGGLIWERVMVSPALDAKGGISHLLCIRENLTSRMEVEEKLAQAEKQLEEEARSRRDAVLSEEIFLTLQGAAHWVVKFADAKMRSKHVFRPAAVISEALQSSRGSDQAKGNETAALPLSQMLVKETASINCTLPPGRKITFRGSKSFYVAGESWLWAQVLSLAARNFLAGNETRAELLITAKIAQRKQPKESPVKVLRLKFSKKTSARTRSPIGKDAEWSGDHDLSFVAGIARSAGGAVISGFEKPWDEPLELEIPILKV